jgi:hypothetical protein
MYSLKKQFKYDFSMSLSHLRLHERTYTLKPGKISMGKMTESLLYGFSGDGADVKKRWTNPIASWSISWMNFKI